MGTSTNGIICFGVNVEEGAELPWDEYDGEIEDWWREVVLEYKPPFELFGEDGDWIDGVPASNERRSEYFQHRRDFDARNPALPIELVMHCSCDYSMYIIADRDTVMENSRGYPVRIDVNRFYVPPERVKAIEDFVKKWEIPVDGDIGWWLVSLWC